MVADGMAPCVAGLSTPMLSTHDVLIVWDRKVLVFHKEKISITRIVKERFHRFSILVADGMAPCVAGSSAPMMLNNVCKLQLYGTYMYVIIGCQYLSGLDCHFFS